ncbi:MAG: DUF2384 domain-containing protein [Taibaiella sp.]|nr:DUF2384 domain-containing protein [Taibaiella sp.]
MGSKDYLNDEKRNEVEPSVVNEYFVAYNSTTATSAKGALLMMGIEGNKGIASVANDSDLISVIRSGIPRAAMDHMMEIADISLVEMAAIIHTSDRTLRRYTAAQKLSQEQSERMVELARLYSRGEQVLGSLPEFREWMNTRLLAFGDKRPKEFLDTSLGINMIMDELGRIEHGIFA